MNQEAFAMEGGFKAFTSGVPLFINIAYFILMLYIKWFKSPSLSTPHPHLPESVSVKQQFSK